MSERDPIIQKYRRDVLVRILLPFIAVTVLIFAVIIAFGVMVAMDTMSMNQLSVTADVIMIFIVLLPAVILMALVDFGIIMLAWGNGKLPKFLAPIIRWIRRRLINIAEFAEQGAEHAVKPIIFVEKMVARITTFWAEMLKFFENKSDDDNASSQPETKIHVEEL